MSDCMSVAVYVFVCLLLSSKREREMRAASRELLD